MEGWKYKIIKGPFNEPPKIFTNDSMYIVEVPSLKYPKNPNKSHFMVVTELKYDSNEGVYSLSVADPSGKDIKSIGFEKVKSIRRMK